MNGCQIITTKRGNSSNSLISKRYIPYTDLPKNFAFEAGLLSVPFARLVMARFAADQLGEDFKLCDCDVPIFIIFEFFVR